jgi:hypothetical protein
MLITLQTCVFIMIPIIMLRIKYNMYNFYTNKGFSMNQEPIVLHCDKFCFITLLYDN